MSQLIYELLQEDVPEGSFSCGNAAIDSWVFQSYYVTLLQHGYAYRIMGNGTILGYFMIMFRNVEPYECPEEISDYREENLCSQIPSVCIKYIAIDKRYQRRGIGTQALRFIINFIKRHAEVMPIRLITIDAVENLVEWYKKEGFVKMPFNPQSQEGVTVYMYFDCIRNPEKVKEYISLKI